MRPSVAIVGSGVSGLAAAYALRGTHRVTLFEADSRFGGHAHTHAVRGADGRELLIDSGFIVHNERTYPTLLRIFRELGVRTQSTEMSMSISCAGCGLEYAGGRGLPGITAQPWRLMRPEFLRLLFEVPRFHRAARKLLRGGLPADLTWGEFLEHGRYSEYFVHHFAIPLVSCVWSAGDADSRSYPAKHLFEFLQHHGMLTIGNSPTWRTVVGGSQQYVQRIISLIPDARISTPVLNVRRTDDQVVVTTTHGVEHFDYAIIATHANTALRLLDDLDPDEASALQSIDYSSNETWLHTDSDLLPSTKNARASWNYRMLTCSDVSDAVVVSYWMNKLMHIESATEYMVTLNATKSVKPDEVIARMRYEHPIFTVDAVRAAAVLRTAGGPRLAFAGAHLGWGFHEDGARSGVEAARKVGGTW